MSVYPKTFTAESAPEAMLALVRQLMDLLLAGSHPTLAILRQQYARAQISTLTLTGAGFYADFDVAVDAPRTSEESFSGGDVAIDLEGVATGGGCVLFVREGRLAFLEGYVNGEEPWPDEPSVRALGPVHPLISDEAVA